MGARVATLYRGIYNWLQSVTTSSTETSQDMDSRKLVAIPATTHNPAKSDQAECDDAEIYIGIQEKVNNLYSDRSCRIIWALKVSNSESCMDSHAVLACILDIQHGVSTGFFFYAKQCGDICLHVRSQWENDIGGLVHREVSDEDAGAGIKTKDSDEDVSIEVHGEGVAEYHEQQSDLVATPGQGTGTKWLEERDRLREEELDEVLDWIWEVSEHAARTHDLFPRKWQKMLLLVAHQPGPPGDLDATDVFGLCSVQISSLDVLVARILILQLDYRLFANMYTRVTRTDRNEIYLF